MEIYRAREQYAEVEARAIPLVGRVPSLQNSMEASEVLQNK